MCVSPLPTSLLSEGAGPLSGHSICDSPGVKPGWLGIGRGRGVLDSGTPLPSVCHLGAETAFGALETSGCGVSHGLLPWALTSVGKGEGHTRADLFLTSLRLSPGEPEMDTKSRVVWVAGNGTKFSKTVAGGGRVSSEPNPAPSGQDL